MELEQFIKLMPVLFVVTFTASVVHMVISVKGMNHYLSQSHPDRWRDITSISDTFPRVKNYLFYVFGSLDNEDNKIVPMKMAVKQSGLYALSNFGALLVTLVMGQFLPDLIIPKG